MPDWVNRGTVRDLSHLADNSITATSQSAGNMTSSNAQAMTAPGSQPVTPLPPTRDQDTPDLTMTSRLEVGDTGKEVPHGGGDWNPPHAAWKPTASPEPDFADPPDPPQIDETANNASIGVAGPAQGRNSGKPARARAAAAATGGHNDA